MTTLLDPQLSMGVVTLNVADLKRSLPYYQKHIGLTVLKQESGLAQLGTGGRHLLTLQEVPGAKHNPNATGLYHFALLLPSRLALAQTIQHFVNSRTPIGGASDHDVSEALYLTDPDGHGIEIYRDRPREAWYTSAGQFHMSTKPMNVDEVMAELAGHQAAWTGLHPDTVMGHVHLQVDDVPQAERFYTEVLGFDHMMYYPDAAFISTGGYHHHLGMNVWHSRGATPPPADAARLVSYELVLSSEETLTQLQHRVEAAGYPIMVNDNGYQLSDPAGNAVVLRTAS